MKICTLLSNITSGTKCCALFCEMLCDEIVCCDVSLNQPEKISEEAHLKEEGVVSKAGFDSRLMLTHGLFKLLKVWKYRPQPYKSA